MTTEQFYLLIGLNAVGVLLLIVLVLRLKSSSQTNKSLSLIASETRLLQEKVIEKNNDIKLYVSNELSRQTRQSTTDFIQFTERMMKTLDEQMDRVNRRVDEKLGNGFEQTNKTFSDVIERLSKIDAAQKQIEKLSVDVISLNDILNDKKTRGTFGEVQLKQLFVAVFGENKPLIYELQKKLVNDTFIDVLLHAPDPMGDLCIDSKFPLENYRRMSDSNLSELERREAEKVFVSDIKTHIDSIALKYIIPGVTADQAIMFIPAEAIFADIVSKYESLLTYGQQKRVWITSPTTLMSTLTVIQIVLRDIERNKYAREIQKELTNLAIDFDRYKERWDRLLKNLDTVSKTAKEVNISSSKISEKFRKISSGETLEESEIIEITEFSEENG
ncbi:DNA recombination protein RmuC [Acholeplasma vituli]|uniref:DNA recombination protein RmuC n=1 Tax=Paracholeplasma vituli TaxID=69473 RepID=A0ABT2PTD6_9MOLU|nr:DNA recombination protein RmuC [Paracholeplasma vituli]MCU0104214.1 DNA recombination protein RmuC [Paracholeplasma vituli]